MVLPKDLRQFLPSLDEASTSEISPTTDRYLRVEMFVGTSHLVDGVIRYQFQTWGGTRSAESRITEGFQPLYHRAVEGDLIVFQRHADVMDRFRLLLIKQGTSEFAEMEQFVAGRRWGSLFETNSPVTQRIMFAAATELTSLIQQPFQVIRPNVPRVETRQSRIARSSVFRECVRREYARRCAVSGISLATPTSLHEVESAHIVPISEGGLDDIRNGFTLTQTLHWAFDRGLFGVLPNRTIYVPRRVKTMTENAFIKNFEGKRIAEANTKNLQVHEDAFSWHMAHPVRQWD
jgi:putative restriction endonuclease